MSLATRCPACGTCFKLVTDQLRLAQGWVRCGRCDEVFLASRHLVERPASPAPQPEWPGLSASAKSPEHDAGEVPSRIEPSITTTTPSEEDGPFVGAPPAVTDPSDPMQATPGIEPSADMGDTEAGRPAPLANPPAMRRYVWDSTHSTSAEPRRRLKTALWATVAVVATLGLAVQAAYAWRDALASHLPATEGPLQSLCTWVGCRVEPVRQLSSLSVDSSDLSPWGGTIYKISLVVSNRSDRPLMMPMIDLTLTDVRGAVIARRALPLSDFGVASTTIGPRQQLALQGHLNAGDRNVAGYTIELFHP